MKKPVSPLQHNILLGLSFLLVTSFFGISQLQSIKAAAPRFWQSSNFWQFPYSTSNVYYDNWDVLPDNTIIAHNNSTGINEIYTHGANNTLDAHYLQDLSSQSTVTGAIAHDGYGNIFVGDVAQSRIDKYDSSYNFVTSYPSNYASVLTVDPATNDLYYTSVVSGYYNIHQVTPAGENIVVIQDAQPGRFDAPTALAVSGDYIYVSNLTANAAGNLIYFHCLYTCAGVFAGSMVPQVPAGPSSDDYSMPQVANMVVDNNGYLYVNIAVQGQSKFYIYNPDHNLVYSSSDIYNVQLVAANDKIFEFSAPNQGGNFVYLFNNYLAQLPHKITLAADTSGNALDGGHTDVTTTGMTGTQSVVLKKDDLPLAEVDQVDFSANRDWSGLSSGMDADQGKSFVHGMLSLPGVTAPSYTLYIPVPSGHTSAFVHICPGATSLADVSGACTNGYTLANGGSIGAVYAWYHDNGGLGDYWEITGVTGTGGVSILDSNPSPTATISDTLSREQAGVASNHTIDFYTVNGLTDPADSFVISFANSFNMDDIQPNDIAMEISGVVYPVSDTTPALNTWGVTVNATAKTLTFAAPITGSDPGTYIAADTNAQVLIGIFPNDFNTGNVQIGNPLAIGSYLVSITNNTQGGTELANMTIPIVDSDQINITSYVNTFIDFDIDSAVADVHCAFNSCLTHEHGEAGSNYTVDLGELNSTWVNQSNSNSVMHSDGHQGVINSVYLNLSTNAINGAIVNVASANGSLQGPANNTINSVTDGDAITANAGLYGFQLTGVEQNNGTIDLNANCRNGSMYCALPHSGELVFDTNNKPLEGGRIRIDLAAAAAYTNNPGTYTDTLTFIATATY